MRLRNYSLKTIKSYLSCLHDFAACFKPRHPRELSAEKVSIHSLRHAFATHLLEAGTDIRYIQEILGHQSSKTTEIYTHVSKKSLGKIGSPLDQTELEKIINTKE